MNNLLTEEETFRGLVEQIKGVSIYIICIILVAICTIKILIEIAKYLAENDGAKKKANMNTIILFIIGIPTSMIISNFFVGGKPVHDGDEVDNIVRSLGEITNAIIGWEVLIASAGLTVVFVINLVKGFNENDGAARKNYFKTALFCIAGTMLLAMVGMQLTNLVTF